MKPFITLKELKDLLQKKECSAEEVLNFYLARIEKYNSKLNSFLEVFDKDELKKKLNDKGILLSIPGAMKNNISIKDKITSCGSTILKNYKSTYDATITKRLREEGATFIGTTNMDEFAMGASGEFSAFGPTKNPWDLERVPGGSSSGSASAVAAGLVPWAIGTETGGSVRQPAAFCGLVGLYPTYGRFSRYGLVAYASSTDQPGPLTKTVYDNALISTILSGHDSKDSTSAPKPRVNFLKNLTGNFPGVTVGVIKDSFKEGVDEEVKSSFEKAIKHIESLGGKIKEIDIPDMRYGISVYFVLTYAEAASNLSRFDGSLYGNRVDAKSLSDMYIKTRSEGFGSEVKRRILLGNYVLSSAHKQAYYERANHIRGAIRAEFDEAFKGVDLLLSPTTSKPAFKIGETVSDPISMYLNDYFTSPMCIAGIPAISLTCGYTKNNLPIGFQFVGPAFSEELLYQSAYAFEQSTDFHLKNPVGYE